MFSEKKFCLSVFPKYKCLLFNLMLGFKLDLVCRLVRSIIIQQDSFRQGKCEEVQQSDCVHGDIMDVDGWMRTLFKCILTFCTIVYTGV